MTGPARRRRGTPTVPSHGSRCPGGARSSERAGSSDARSDREDGSATILALGVVLGLVTVLLGALLLVAVLVAGQRARAAADLAALAGAGAAVQGLGQAEVCDRAAAVAADNDALLVRCRLVAGDGFWPDVQVSTRCEVTGTSWTTAAIAVAGGRPLTDP